MVALKESIKNDQLNKELRRRRDFGHIVVESYEEGRGRGKYQCH